MGSLNAITACLSIGMTKNENSSLFFKIGSFIFYSFLNISNISNKDPNKFKLSSECIKNAVASKYGHGL